MRLEVDLAPIDDALESLLLSFVRALLLLAGEGFERGLFEFYGSLGCNFIFYETNSLLVILALLLLGDEESQVVDLTEQVTLLGSGRVKLPTFSPLLQKLRVGESFG